MDPKQVLLHTFECTRCDANHAKHTIHNYKIANCYVEIAKSRMRSCNIANLQFCNITNMGIAELQT